MGKPINVAIIGIEGYGRTYFQTLRQEQDVNILALCDIHLDAARKAAQDHGVAIACSDYQDLLHLKDLDAVLIATPHYLHHAMTMDFLRAGKHVLCEKPLAIRAAQAWEMARTSRDLGLLLTCHYNRRQSLAVKMLRDIVKKGVLGDVYTLNVKWMARWTGFMYQSATSWRTSKEKAGGGILIGRGSHMIDAALYILGHPPCSAVNAFTSTRLANFEVDDYAFVTLRLANGAVINVECSYENHIPHYAEKIEYEAFGTRAGAYCAAVDGQETIQVGYCAFPNSQWVDLTAEINPAAYAQAEPRSIVGDFIQAVKEQRDPLISAEQGALVSQVLELAYHSSESGCEVAFEL